MKNIKLYLILLVFVCVGVVGFWIYIRYIKTDDIAPLTFTVNRSSLDQLVRARGKVVSQKSYDLSFATSGTIQSILVKEGEVVSEHQPLVQLDTRGLQHDRASLVSVLAQKQSAYDKLVAGTRSEEVNVYATKVQNAGTVLADAQKSQANVNAKADADLTALYEQVSDLLADASVTADDAVRQDTEVFFSNDDTSVPTLNFFFTNAGLKYSLETDRVSIGQELKSIASDASASSGASQVYLDGYLKNTETHLIHIQTFLDQLASALNSTISLSDTTIAIHKTSVNTARANINTVRTNITTLTQKISVQKSTNQQAITQAQTTINSAKNSLTLSNNELSLKAAGAQSQDLRSALASVSEIQDKIASIDDQIQKSTLESPAEGIISHISFEAHEVVQAGQVVVNFSALGQKIESDVSELDITKIRDNGTQNVNVKLDAYPNVVFKGLVMSTDVQEIVKDGDTYYRVNILLDPQETFVIRSGMSADVAFIVSTAENVLTVPAFLVRKQKGTQIVNVLKNGKRRDVTVKTGVTDGDRMEILEGLSEGDTVFSSAK